MCLGLDGYVWNSYGYTPLPSFPECSHIFVTSCCTSRVLSQKYQIEIAGKLGNVAEVFFCPHLTSKTNCLRHHPLCTQLWPPLEAMKTSPGWGSSWVPLASEAGNDGQVAEHASTVRVSNGRSR